MPLHAWLHPWLPMLQTRLQDLHPGIRFKLATALQQWHPADQSAMALLSPWHHVRPCPDAEPRCNRPALSLGLGARHGNLQQLFSVEAARAPTWLRGMAAWAACALLATLLPS